MKQLKVSFLVTALLAVFACAPGEKTSSNGSIATNPEWKLPDEYNRLESTRIARTACTQIERYLGVPHNTCMDQFAHSIVAVSDVGLSSSDYSNYLLVMGAEYQANIHPSMVEVGLCVRSINRWTPSQATQAYLFGDVQDHFAPSGPFFGACQYAFSDLTAPMPCDPTQTECKDQVVNPVGF